MKIFDAFVVFLFSVCFVIGFTICFSMCCIKSRFFGFICILNPKNHYIRCCIFDFMFFLFF